VPDDVKFATAHAVWQAIRRRRLDLYLARRTAMPSGRALDVWQAQGLATALLEETLDDFTRGREAEGQAAP